MVTREDIFTLLGAYLSRIQDVRLREQVVEVWVLACKEGGWDTVQEVLAMPFTLLTATHGINFVEHTLAVTAGALGLAEAQVRSYKALPYAINTDILIAGGLLHDVGKLLEAEKDGKGGFRKSRGGKLARHPISGSLLAARVGLSDDVINTIACHAKEGEGAPKRLETILIHQADFATFDPLVALAKGDLIQDVR